MSPVLLVDDHPLVRKGIMQALAFEFPESVVLEAASAAEALAIIWNQTLELVLLDLSLPGRGGLDLLKEIKGVRPRLPVLILSAHPEEQFATRALKAGASGYLNKNTPADILLKAVRRVIAGGKFVSETTGERLAAELTLDSSKPLHEHLSDREYDVLLRIAAGQSVSAVAAILNLSVKTISTYRTRILEKMGKQNNAELTQYALRNNLIE